MASGTQGWVELWLGREPSALPHHEQLSHMALLLEHSPEPTLILTLSRSHKRGMHSRRHRGQEGLQGPGELARAGLIGGGGLCSGPSDSPFEVFVVVLI